MVACMRLVPHNAVKFAAYEGTRVPFVRADGTMDAASAMACGGVCVVLGWVRVLGWRQHQQELHFSWP